jgi:hypothetical protein
MSWDPAPHFEDAYGNDYVGIDLGDAENLVGLLERLLDFLASPAIYEELCEHLRPDGVKDLVDELDNQLDCVRHLVAPGRR